MPVNTKRRAAGSIALLSAIVSLSFSQFAAAQQGGAAMQLWYDKPAAKWTEANPLGNGRLGCMVFGGTAKEKLQLNEDTIWAGGPRSYAHDGAAEHLPQIRQLLFEGKQKEATELAGKQFMSEPLRQFPYQPLGDINLEFPGHESATNYRRELDIDTAIASISYTVDGVKYRREIFSSHPAQAIVVRLSADKPSQLNFSVGLSSLHAGTAVKAASGNLLVMNGGVENFSNKRIKQEFDSAIKFEARLLISPEGGQLDANGGAIKVSGANAVTLKLVAATNFVNFRDVSGDPAARCEKVMPGIWEKSFSESDPKSYDALRREHVEDHQKLFRRVALELGVTDKTQLPTDQRIKAFGAGDDPQLAATYFQFGRYLLIASSRPGCQPANLQGIWNDSKTPAWDSKYTVNINTEMNYWPAEMCNLAECAEPLFDMLDDVLITGREVAKKHYNSRGWVLHHNTDLWRGAAPINASNHGIWPTGGAWLCQNLWWHYEFGGDKDFLAKRAYPLMKGAALFFVDNLTEDPRNDQKWLISTPSNSPEIGGLVAGPTMDHQIIRNLFTNVIKASEVLGVDADLRKQLTEMRARIAPNQVGQHGQLQEWLEDTDNPKNQHRHCSHLWGLHPGNEITPATPKIFAAAKQSLVFRGDGGTGWSKAWKVNFWARLLEGDHSYLMLSELISKSTMPNMFDTHPPFQIDGNFGGTSGITEMLLQSHTGEVNLLPALPSAWPSGSVRGLRARGGFEVDIAWKDGKLAGATLRSTLGNSCKLRYGDKAQTLKTSKGKTYELDAKLAVK